MLMKEILPIDANVLAIFGVLQDMSLFSQCILFFFYTNLCNIKFINFTMFLGGNCIKILSIDNYEALAIFAYFFPYTNHLHLCISFFLRIMFESLHNVCKFQYVSWREACQNVSERKSVYRLQCIVNVLFAPVYEPLILYIH